MKLIIAFLPLSLAVLLTVGSGCSFNIGNANVPAPNIAANTNANADPAGTPASITFESSPDKDEPNRFVFDDETYNIGTFYRADGKTFPIKRAK